MTMKSLVALSLLIASLFFASGAKGLDKKWMKPKVVGDFVPSVTFKTRVRTEEQTENPFDWKDVTTEDLFKGKRVVVFALPGAFTPTCKYAVACARKMYRLWLLPSKLT